MHTHFVNRLAAAHTLLQQFPQGLVMSQCRQVRRCNLTILGGNKAALSLCVLTELLERMQAPCNCVLHGSRSTMALSKCRHMTHMADEHQVLVSKVAARVPLGHVGCSEGPLMADKV
jgi:hypothetical protein